MPIFEYECETCHRNFEKLVFNNTEKIACPGCGSAETRKLVSCASFLGSTGSGACAPSAPSKGYT